MNEPTTPSGGGPAYTDIVLPDLVVQPDASLHLGPAFPVGANEDAIEESEPVDADDLGPVLGDRPAFPTDALPMIVRDYVTMCARSLGAPPEMVAVPLLAVLAGALGNSYALALKGGWTERAILWTGIVSATGTAKSPALGHAQDPLSIIQGKLFDDFYRELETWKANGSQGDRPEPEHVLTTDITIEAVAKVLSEGATSGLVIVYDELGGWLKSHGAYKRGGADREHYLSLWTGSSLKIDRVTKPTIFIHNPAVSITGGIQPSRLSLIATDDEVESGLTPRFLLAWPNSRALRWSSIEVSGIEVVALSLRLEAIRAGGGLVSLCPEARERFAALVDANADAVDGASGYMRAVLAKHPAHAARVALVLHVMEHAAAAPTVPVPVETIERAQRIMAYFVAHAAFIAAATNPVTAKVLALLTREWQSETAIHRSLGNNWSARKRREALNLLERLGIVESRRRKAQGRGRTPMEWRLFEN